MDRRPPPTRRRFLRLTGTAPGLTAASACINPRLPRRLV